MELVVLIYKITNTFPDTERFGLTSQLRRCSVSVPSNIAEGWGRKSSKSFVGFLHIAQGSLCELETQLILAEELGFTSPGGTVQTKIIIEEIGKMLVGLERSLLKS